MDRSTPSSEGFDCYRYYRRHRPKETGKIPGFICYVSHHLGKNVLLPANVLAVAGGAARGVVGIPGPAKYVAEPVDQPDPVGDHVGAVGDQQSQFGHQRRGNLDLGQIAALADGLGDDVGVTGIGLGFTALGVGHLVRDPAGFVFDRLCRAPRAAPVAARTSCRSRPLPKSTARRENRPRRSPLESRSRR